MEPNRKSSVRGSGEDMIKPSARVKRGKRIRWARNVIRVYEAYEANHAALRDRDQIHWERYARAKAILLEAALVS